MRDTTNPYQAPEAVISEAPEAEEFGEVGLFKNTRIGRIRYLAYGMAAGLIVAAASFVVGFLGILTGGSEFGAALATILGYAALFIFQMWLTVRRTHDFNTSGWLALLTLVPLVGLIFLFIPGTAGTNRFGPKPPPNNRGVIWMACSIFIVFAIGILAAIALPAYKDYAARARAAQEFSQQR